MLNISLPLAVHSLNQWLSSKPSTFHTKCLITHLNQCSEKEYRRLCNYLFSVCPGLTKHKLARFCSSKSAE